MSEISQPIQIKRILVSLDSSKHSYAALIAALDLAERYSAKVKGIFVEDINLLNLSKLPFHQEIGQYSAHVREISTDGITRGIIVQSRWVTRTFQRLITQKELEGDISILRGHVSEMILKEMKHFDLIILGKSGTKPIGTRKIGSTAGSLILKQQKPLLLVEEGNQINQPIIVFYENSTAGKRSLETAADLVDESENLVIMIASASVKSLEDDKKFLKHWAEGKNIRLSFQTYHPHRLDRTLFMLKGLKTGLFILPKSTDPKHQVVLEHCLNMIDLPILLIQES